MSLLWLQVSACEQRVCIHRLTLWVCCGFRHQPANNGLFSPAAHYEFAVASGIRCEQRGCIHLLHIMSLWWLRDPTGRSWGQTCDALGVEWGWRYPTVNNGRVFTGCTLWVCCGFWDPIWTMGLYSPAAHHAVVVASGIRLQTSWGVIAMHWESEWGWRYPTANNGVVHRLHIMSLQWLWYPIANNGLYSPAAHNESAVASGIRLNNGVVFTGWKLWVSVALVSDANNGVVFTCCTSWVCSGFGYPTAEKLRGLACYALGVWWGWRYPTVNNGVVSPAAHYESAVASVSDANMGFSLLRIGGWWG